MKQQLIKTYNRLFDINKYQPYQTDGNSDQLIPGQRFMVKDKTNKQKSCREKCALYNKACA